MAGNMTRSWIMLDFDNKCIIIDDIVQNEEKKQVNMSMSLL